MEFYSVENAYVAGKTTNPKEREKIKTLTPFRAKCYGRILQRKQVNLNPDWNDGYRLKLMTELVYQKFSKNSDLKFLLFETDGAYLEEGNYWHDNFFGVCTCGTCPTNKLRPEDERNNLGKILMHTRTRLHYEAT